MAEVKEDNVTLLAAGVAFYAMLAIFPAIIAVVTVYGLVADPNQVEAQVSEFAKSLPAGADQLLTEQLQNVASAGRQSLSIGLAVSLLAVLWTASGGVQGLVKGLNVVYDERETRGFLKLRGLSLLLTLGAILVAVIALALVAVFPAVIDNLGLGQAGAGRLHRPLGRAGPAGAARPGCGVPVRPRPGEPALALGQLGRVVALVLWLLGSFGFSWYVDNFGKYNQTYGALAAVIILLLWLFLSAFAVLLGAELDAEIERQTGRDTTTGPERPLGERRRGRRHPARARSAGDGAAGRDPHLPPGSRAGQELEGRLALPESYVAALRGRGPGGAAAPSSRGTRRSCWRLRRPAAGRRRHRAGRYGADDHSTQYGIDPDRDRLELGLARAAVRLELPVLGICRGVQLLNVAFGGTLVQHLEDGDAKVVHRDDAMQAMHGLRVEPGSRLAEAVGQAEAEGLSHHHQALDRLGRVPAGRLGAGRAGRGDRARRRLDRWRALAPREHGRHRPRPAAAAGDLRERGVPAWAGILARERRAGRVWPARERPQGETAGRSVRPSR